MRRSGGASARERRTASGSSSAEEADLVALGVVGRLLERIALDHLDELLARPRRSRRRRSRTLGDQPLALASSSLGSAAGEHYVPALNVGLDFLESRLGQRSRSWAMAIRRWGPRLMPRSSTTRDSLQNNGLLPRAAPTGRRPARAAEPLGQVPGDRALRPGGDDRLVDSLDVDERPPAVPPLGPSSGTSANTRSARTNFPYPSATSARGAAAAIRIVRDCARSHSLTGSAGRRCG